MRWSRFSRVLVFCLFFGKTACYLAWQGSSFRDTFFSSLFCFLLTSMCMQYADCVAVDEKPLCKFVGAKRNAFHIITTKNRKKKQEEEKIYTELSGNNMPRIVDYFWFGCGKLSSMSPFLLTERSFIRSYFFLAIVPPPLFVGFVFSQMDGRIWCDFLANNHHMAPRHESLVPCFRSSVRRRHQYHMAATRIDDETAIDSPILWSRLRRF